MSKRSGLGFGLTMVLGGLCWLLALARSPTEPVPLTPAQTFGELFARVQTARVFPDSKTFADATPVTDPRQILERFHEDQPRTRAALAAFVSQHFTIPEAVGTAALPPGQTLRAHIASLWPLLTRPAGKPPLYSSLLFVPYPYVVPGGRFREFYYWDSYFSMLGLLQDGGGATARGMVQDFAYLIDRFGHIPNGTRSYYLSRSQPPVFYLMAALLRGEPAGPASGFLAQMRREHAFWMRGSEHLPAGQARERVVALTDGAVLNRYWDALATPRDESYREDLRLAAAAGRGSRQMYRDIRAAAESGWDFSSRWMADGRTLPTLHTTDVVPIDLNSLLYGLEVAIAGECRRSADARCERHFLAASRRRRAAVMDHMWDGNCACFVDFDRRAGRRLAGLTAATLYPLFVGLADRRQAAAVSRSIQAHLLSPGGLMTTLVRTGQQWDAPNGWPPLQWIAINALERYGQHELARELARRWLATVERVYRQTGRLLEKYDVETVRPGGGGEYPLQDGFGWTNGVTRALLSCYPDLNPAPAQAPGAQTAKDLCPWVAPPGSGPIRSEP